MKVALVNPAWTFEGSIYFGCRGASAARARLFQGHARAQRA